MRTSWAVAILFVCACSSPTTGSGSSAIDAGTKVDTSLTAGDAKDTVGVQTLDAVLDTTDDDAAATDTPDVPDVQSLDIPGFFDDTTVVCGTTGQIIGVACAPKAGISVAFASVSLQVDSPCLTSGTSYQATTTADAKGAYSFNGVPPGTGTVTVVKGSFQTAIPVNVVGGQKVDLTLPSSDRCFKSSAVNIAVVKGNADQIETLLDGLGFTHTDFATSSSATSAGAKFLGDLTAMNGYDVIFIDCGSNIDNMMAGAAKATITSNIQAFVNAGHSLYASDWAWQIVQAAFPAAVDYFGVDASLTKSASKSTTAGPRQGPGPTTTQKKAGAPPFTMNGDIVDANLAAAVGKASTTIYEDLSEWVVMAAANTGTTVEVQAAVNDGKGNDWGVVPLVVRFGAGKGHVVYTSFHNIAVKDAGGPVADIQAILTYLVFTL